MRFAWFRWHERVFAAGVMSERGAFPFLQVFTNSPVRGGDLTTLMGHHPQVNLYKEWKPAATNWSDEFGFRNRPPTMGKAYSVIVVGDSFMMAGARMEDTFAGMLESRTGLLVYNYAVDGRGPLWPMAQFLASPRFKTNPPPMVVWGLLERDLPGLAYSEEVAIQIGIRPRTSIRAMHLKPDTLKRELSDTAASAQVAARLWSYVTGLLATSSEVPVIEAADHSMLFYKPAIVSMSRPVDFVAVSNIAETVARVAEMCRNRGSELVVVLIPDKERVYVERLPNAAGEGQVAPSILGALESLLESRNVKAVNLLPIFRAHALRGEALYWRDDTHWNSRGIELAVESLVTSWTPGFSATAKRLQ